MRHNRLIQIFILLLLCSSIAVEAQDRPNILLIIADDMGVDALNGYDVGTVLPNTPNIDKLRETGVTFTSTWACPACAPTRATMLTGKYGLNNGINTVPGILSTDHKSIFKELDELTDTAYASCVVGKWHLSSLTDIDHPYSHGADDFMGVMGYGVEDYSNWAKVEAHESAVCTEYATSYFTDYATNWINEQTKPWLMWLAHLAPHTPFHVPPSEMYTSQNASTNLQKFIVMIESLDYEIGRLLDSIPQSVLDSTVIIFIGDNGTIGNILQGFPQPLGKNTVYQGGIHVPMIVSGYGVTRINEKEDALINASDIYATIAQIAQPDAYPTGQVNDSYSFKHLLSGNEGTNRTYNYMELGANLTIPNDVYTIRDSQYKIIYDVAGNKDFFDLSVDPFEANNLLLANLNTEQTNAKLDLEQQMYAINGIVFENEPPNDTITNTYSIVGTGVVAFYSNNALITETQPGDPYHGQDANYHGNLPSYTNNGDGTITDNVTGLMWEQDMVEKISFEEAFIKAEESTLGGYDDWRFPTIKELYSLILFTGNVGIQNTALKLFIDTLYFNQPIGDTSIGEREIDAQTWSATEYTGITMNKNETVFGVNFVDGHIKGYPKNTWGAPHTMYCRLVRGNTEYGKNNFVDNGDGTISDLATGLMWQQSDDGVARDWGEALEYAENLNYANYSDWRLPNAKELQSIVDYTRSPQATNTPAIDPIFATSEINDLEGNSGHYPYFWTNSTFLRGNSYANGVYITFGEGRGVMNGILMDVHGAGCQRSDPKSGNSEDYPSYSPQAPQGDVNYVYNHVRTVRDIPVTSSINDVFDNELKIYPNPASNHIMIDSDRTIENISIYTIQGVLIKNKSVQKKSVQLNISQLSNGIYIISITDDLGQQNTEKIIVK